MSEPPDPNRPNRPNRPDQDPDPRIALTLLFINSLFLAQLASSFITSRNITRMYESDGQRRNERFQKMLGEQSGEGRLEAGGGRQEGGTSTP